MISNVLTVIRRRWNQALAACAMLLAFGVRRRTRSWPPSLLRQDVSLIIGFGARRRL